MRKVIFVSAMLISIPVVPAAGEPLVRTLDEEYDRNTDHGRNEGATLL